MAAYLESKIQQACVRVFRYEYPGVTIFAIPNGGARTKTQGGILKAEGVLAGVADLFVMAARGKQHGLFIEMKIEDGRQSDTQRLFMKSALDAGYAYEICRSLHEFEITVKLYLKQK